MTIQIELRPDEERELRERARRSGRDLAEYLHQVLVEHIQGPARDADARTLEQILTPIWDGFRQSGTSEPDAEELLEEELQAARRERKGSP